MSLFHTLFLVFYVMGVVCNERENRVYFWLRELSTLFR